MSKINAVRLININYNNNNIRVSDETFHFNGESTLLSLRNGGGKSVLVQMMTAPFVHKRYRDAKDRPFESYFTTGKPSFILVEWALEQGAGYVMTGMMVRKSQEVEEGNLENLDMVNFISEYKGSCLQDIHRLPVVEKGKREMILKNFAACRQLFESYKRDRAVNFFSFDMNNHAQSRQYFEKLAEYQINYKEWETIIKKVNLKESGLSDLFADCKDEKGLVEKWFLDAVEHKLNKERNRMKEFQSILEKYVGQYKDNQSKIKRRDTIRLFQEKAEQIEEKNRTYRENGRKVEAQENRIACFRQELETLHQEYAGKEQENRQQAEQLRQEMERLNYEKLSEEYYRLEEEKKFHASNRDMIELEKEGLEREAEKIQTTLNLFLCARQREAVNEEKADWELAAQQLAVAREKDRDLEPERKAIGALLCRHYQSALENVGASLKENQRQRKETAEEIQKEQKLLEELEESLRKNALRAGELKSRIRSFDRTEEQFNVRYQEQLLRNILGEYEPGSLEIFGEVCRRSIEEQIRLKTSKNRELEQAKNRKISLERSQYRRNEEKAFAAAARKQQQNLQELYEKELADRRDILKYLELEESALFEEAKIFQAADRKLLEIDSLRRNLEKEENELQKEYQRITEGKVLELPPELAAEFEKAGIHIVYGMEWLKKNGYSRQKNRELVRSHPFLPYALILSEGEAEKLSRLTGSIPTGFPIPIVLRKSLEQQGKEKNGNLIAFPGIRFYLLFNENLLDEEKLQQLAAQIQRQIEKKQEMAAIRRKEYGDYFAWKEQVKNQQVYRDNYQENQKQLQESEEKLQKLEQEIRQASQELSGLQEEISGLEGEIRTAEKQTEILEQKNRDFAEVLKAYEEYQEDRRQQEKCQREEQHLAESQKLSRLKEEKLQEKLQTLCNRQSDLERDQEKQQEQLGLYQSYEGKSLQELPEEIKRRLPKEASELEARYRAVTAAVSREIQSLEEQELRSGRRYQKACGELSHLSEKYRLTSDQWAGIVYSRREETHQEIQLEDRRKKLKIKESLWNEEDKQTALLTQQMQERIKRMTEECGQDCPLPKEEIRSEDFEACKNQLEYQRRELEKVGKSLQNRLNSYNENLTALAEYSELPVKEALEWQEDFAGMDAGNLRNFKGILLRDYNKYRSDQREAREQLVYVLNAVVRLEQFQEDFYRKPLEAMLELSKDAEQVQRQLDTTIQSYQSLMEKLEVDISLVEKEKNKIVELLEEYLQEVHQNLGKIDHNSTIAIRERPVKMLKLQLPSWEENESLYHLRLEDFIDELTQKGIAIFDRNENAQEYFGIQMTTRNLYDTTVGIGNVQIRLYKVEEQREYPITWAEVARNSGGEGFLSAFVILSSLLYYMRRDESDIFADRNEGKVLLMDNPFAQTNASHLLKPLMDMAKKTNTQLICLTGLGGESIYNRFDNIYVLNLVAAGIRQGMQYLKGEHMRGSEPEELSVSQIEVVQQELVF